MDALHQAFTKAREIHLAYALRNETSFETVLDQAAATRVVMALGMLHTLAQLLVCSWKAKKRSAREALGRRRCLTILLGMLLPSFTIWIETTIPGVSNPLHTFGDFMFIPILALVVIGIIAFGGSGLAPYMYVPETHFPSIARNAYALVLFIAGLYVPVSLASLIVWEVGKKCYIMPCTSVKIAEWDQAFALFVALFCLVYEHGPQVSRYLSQMTSPRPRRQHATWVETGVRLERLL